MARGVTAKFRPLPSIEVSAGERSFSDRFSTHLVFAAVSSLACGCCFLLRDSNFFICLDFERADSTSDHCRSHVWKLSKMADGSSSFSLS